MSALHFQKICYDKLQRLLCVIKQCIIYIVEMGNSMRMYDFIYKKKSGQALTKEEMNEMITAYVNKEIPDYQMSAFLMAVCWRGMTLEETIALTKAMADSGEQLDLSPIHGIVVDKHSTGGVGDKTSLVILPMVAALSVPVAKMSGRGLGHTGGTIDKLESFPGFSTSITIEQFFKQVNEIKLAIAGQTANLAPADKLLYALRDVTATVDQVSMVASSIMSKKLASGAKVIVLDVKTGNGAFMKTLEESVELAEIMVQIGNGLGRETYAIITDMNQPLGFYVGNSLEVEEVIATLKGKGPDDLLQISLELASYMLLGVGRVSSLKEANVLLKQTIQDGSALKKFAEFIEAQGGDSDYVFQKKKFRQAALTEDIFAKETGYVSLIHTDEVGMTSLLLGGGRETKESTIDLSVGLKLSKKLGDSVKAGEKLATLYANDPKKLEAAKERFSHAYEIDGRPPVNPTKPIYGIVDKKGTRML